MTSRRGFLGGIGLGTLLAACKKGSDAIGVSESNSSTGKGTTQSPSSGFGGHRTDLEVDFVIVGAGFAGISAARKLHQAGKSVAVLEARDRIGGRTHTQDFGGGMKLDVGGQWIGPYQTKMYELVNTYGVKIFGTYNEQKNILDLEGKLSQYTGTIPLSLGVHLPGFALLQSTLDELAQTVNLREPWLTPNAQELDSQTFHSWLKNFDSGARGIIVSDVAKKFMSDGMSVSVAADPRRVSLLHVLYYIKTNRNLDTLWGVTDGAQQDRFQEGTHSLLAKMCEPFKSSIHLNNPVRSIHQDAAGVTVYADKLKVKAKRVIVAVPPTIAGRIDYEPILSKDRDRLTQSFPQGTIIKYISIYKDKFWRGKGLSGQATVVGGPVLACYDNSVPGFDRGVLAGFVVGETAEKLDRLTPEKRRHTILSHLSILFGQEAANPSHYVDHSWGHEKWTRGCYVGFATPGVWTNFGFAMRRPEGKIHWAGTETADHGFGFMEGAVRSGERAASEVLST